MEWLTVELCNNVFGRSVKKIEYTIWCNRVCIVTKSVIMRSCCILFSKPPILTWISTTLQWSRNQTSGAKIQGPIFPPKKNGKLLYRNNRSKFSTITGGVIPCLNPLSVLPQIKHGISFLRNIRYQQRTVHNVLQYSTIDYIKSLKEQPQNCI